MNAYLLSALLLLAGCASTPKKTAPFKSEFVGESNTLQQSSQTIEKALTRADYNSLLGEGVAAYPYRGALIEAIFKERGAKNLDNEDKIAKDIEAQKKFFTDGKTCFFVRVTAIGAIERAMFKHWVAKVEQPAGTYHEAAFSNISGVDSVPELLTATGMGASWINISYACTKYKVDLEKEFSLYMIPQITEGKTLKLTWTPETTLQKK